MIGDTWWTGAFSSSLWRNGADNHPWGVLYWVIHLQSLHHSQIEWILLQTIASIENGILPKLQLQVLSHQLSDSFLKFNIQITSRDKEKQILHCTIKM